MYYVFAVIIGYFIGNIATSYLVGKIWRNTDIRQHGSGNLGATNTFRVLGFRAGLIAFAGDVLKGVAAVIIGRLIAGELGGIIAGGAAILGHNWPMFLGFKGGKGIATSLGIIITLFPLISGILFLIGVLIIVVSRYVSLASITTAILFPILLVVFQYKLEYIIAGIVISILAVYRHKSNISRLLNGTENRIVINTRVK